MAEGMRLKQLENRMETMEFGLTQTQEAMTQIREEVRSIREELQEDMATSRDGVLRELVRQRESMDQRISSVINMLSKLFQFRLPPEFPPRSVPKMRTSG